MSNRQEEAAQRRDERRAEARLASQEVEKHLAAINGDHGPVIEEPTPPADNQENEDQ